MLRISLLDYSLLPSKTLTSSQKSNPIRISCDALPCSRESIHWQHRRRCGDSPGPIQNQHHVAHILSVLNSASISFFSEWRTGLSIPTKEITKVYIGDLAAGTAGPDLKLVRMVVPLKDTENGNLLGYLEVCIDFIDCREKKVSFCLITVSPEFTEGFCLSLASVPRWRATSFWFGLVWREERRGFPCRSGETVMQELWKFSTAA